MKKKHGFTLIELLVVITIIGILASFLLPALKGILLSTHRAEIQLNIKVITEAIIAYEGDLGSFPPDRGDAEVDIINRTPTQQAPNSGQLNNTVSEYRDDNLLRHLDGDTENDEDTGLLDGVSARPLDRYLNLKITDIDDSDILKPRIITRFGTSIDYNELASERRTQGFQKQNADPRESLNFFDSFQLYSEAEDIQEKKPERWLTNFRDVK